MKWLIVSIFLIGCSNYSNKDNHLDSYQPTEICVNGVVYYDLGAHGGIAVKFQESGNIQKCRDWSKQ